MPLDEDGNLFVVYGTKVYPIVKNGKNLTFVTYDNMGMHLCNLINLLVPIK